MVKMAAVVGPVISTLRSITKLKPNQAYQGSVDLGRAKTGNLHIVGNNWLGVGND